VEETYTVKKGDSLSKIAKRVYGDAQEWRKIYEANRAIIGDNPDRIEPGQALKLPRA
jgi:nucleoid-associated protein YgaU